MLVRTIGALQLGRRDTLQLAERINLYFLEVNFKWCFLQELFIKRNIILFFSVLRDYKQYRTL